MSGGIFLLGQDGRLIEMREQGYVTEDHLQDLLARYPNLLVSDHADGDEAGRRWLLVTREMGLASDEGGTDRWSVDHLFLDRAGVPTIVEVKRSVDSRIRREVVGQMLDYAANAVIHWPVETIRERFRAQCEARQDDPDQVLANHLGPETDPDQFWSTVKTNLQAGRVRLVFVADHIPPELRRIVEFLNGQMDPAEVLAIEVRQYVGQGLTTLVPRIIGQTEKAQQKKETTNGSAQQWGEESFFKSLAEQHGTDQEKVARKIYDWAADQGLRIWWGRGRKDGSFFPMLDYRGEKHFSFSVWTSGGVEMQFQHMVSRPPFSDPSHRLAIVHRLNQIDGVTIPEEAIHRRPSMSLSVLSDPAALKQFLDTFDWFLEQVRANG